MYRNTILKIWVLLLMVASCEREEFDGNTRIPNFDFPETVFFEDSLSSYNIFDGIPSDLSPSEGFELLELSSVLFTDYSHKQRLVKVPTGTQIRRLNDDSIDFPDGTILTKTFFYYNDERDTTLGKRVVETRLEIKENDIWNAATYIWDENQTDAILEIGGKNTPISWIDENGFNRSTIYHIPTKNECKTCHQSNSQMNTLGPTLLNLNRDIERNGNTINQITYLQNLGLLSQFSVQEISQMVNFEDFTASIEERGRAYLAMNCAHCHNPNSWEKNVDFDFRFETPLNETGIISENSRIKRNFQNGEMPLIGTTLLDEEGVNLIVEYLENL